MKDTDSRENAAKKHINNSKPAVSIAGLLFKTKKTQQKSKKLC